MKTIQVTAKFYNPYEIALVERGSGSNLGIAIKRAVNAMAKQPRSWKGQRSVKRIQFAVDILQA